MADKTFLSHQRLLLHLSKDYNNELFSINNQLADSHSAEQNSIGDIVLWQSFFLKNLKEMGLGCDMSATLRWPTSALRMPNDTPNSKPYSEFLNLTPNSKTSLRIQKPHSEFTKTHSEFKNLTLN